MTTPRQLLGKARVKTFEYVPYLASYIYALRPQETREVETAAVDAEGRLYYNPDYISNADTGQCAYLVAHEALHLIYRHHERAYQITGPNCTHEQQFVLNIAADLVVEQTLAIARMRPLCPQGAVCLGATVPQLGGMTLDFPENLSMQEYYRLIMERLREQGASTETPSGSQKNGGGKKSSAQRSNTGSSRERGSGNSERERQGNPKVVDTISSYLNRAVGSLRSLFGGDGLPAKPTPVDLSRATSGGRGSDGWPQPDDSAEDASRASQPVRPQPGTPGGGGSCADGQPREYEVESDGSWEAYGADMAATQAESAIKQYEQSSAGKVAGTLKQALSQQLRPQPDPFDQLRSAVCTSVAAPIGGRDFSHRRLSRKQPVGDDEPLLHGRICVQPRAVVIVDTSGSMTVKESQAKALSVIGQGLRKLGRVKVICADTHVRSHKAVVTTRAFEWAGGGGTDMARAIEQVEESDKPDSIVLITDAITQWPKRKPRARVVVAYTGQRDSRYHQAIPSWARTVVLNR